MTLPILEPSPTETLADRCARLAVQIDDYERDISNRSVLDLDAIKAALLQASEALTS